MMCGVWCSVFAVWFGFGFGFYFYLFWDVCRSFHIHTPRTHTPNIRTHLRTPVFRSWEEGGRSSFLPGTRDGRKGGGEGGVGKKKNEDRSRLNDGRGKSRFILVYSRVKLILTLKLRTKTNTNTKDDD